MTTESKKITNNYKNYDEISKEVENDLEQFLEFCFVGEYVFVHCYKYNRPKLRHREERCRQTEPYNEELVKLMENKIKGIYRFRKTVKNWKIQEIDEMSVQQGCESEELRMRELKIMMDEMMKRTTKTEGTMTQLVKGK